MEERWRGWDNAEIYDRFVREYRIYGWLNERLVERAHLEDGHRILDLGCGTGATTRACLNRIPGDAEIVGIDASPEMVSIAESRTHDPRARFVVADAGEVASRVDGAFDRAVSNAAFWQFPDVPRVLEALGKLLAPGGLFVFNVPAERVEGGGAPIHPFQVALAFAIADHTGEPYVGSSTPFDPKVLRKQAARHGLVLERSESLAYECAQGELMDLMEIPAMIGPLTGGLDAEAIRRVLDRARESADPGERVRVGWLYLTLRKP